MMRRLLLTMIVLLILSFSARAQFGGGGFGLSGSANTSVLARTLLTAIDPRERAEAARRLGLSGDVRVIQVLARAATGDEDPRVRRVATDAIATIRQQSGTGVVPNPGVGTGGFPGWRPPVPPGFNDPYAELVQSWYQRYLGRTSDWSGLQNWILQLRRGMTQEQLQANILGSDEYYRRRGRTPAGFIHGLYEDVLGRRPAFQEVRGHLDRLDRLRGDRIRFAEQFLEAAQDELARRPVPYDFGSP